MDRLPLASHRETPPPPPSSFVHLLPDLQRECVREVPGEEAELLCLKVQSILYNPGYELPWEEDGGTYPSNMAPALEVAVQASNGASDYGNKFGEPVVTGFARSFGMNMADDERREWIKPIMFSGGMGMLDDNNILKLQPEIGNCFCY